jgi:hypothetical protein
LLANSSAEIWVVKWAQTNVADPGSQQGLYIGVYFALGAIQLIAWSAAGLYVNPESAFFCINGMHTDDTANGPCFAVSLSLLLPKRLPIGAMPPFSIQS